MIAPEHLETIWQQHAGRLLLIARSIGEPAEDAVQEAFIRLAAQPQQPTDVVAWMVQVIRNQLRSWNRSRNRQRQRETAVSIVTPWFDEHTTNIDINELTQRLQSLPGDQREIVVMHHWGGLTFEQIGQLMGKSRSTTHRQYQLGLDALRSHFTTNLPT